MSLYIKDAPTLKTMTKVGRKFRIETWVEHNGTVFWKVGIRRPNKHGDMVWATLSWYATQIFARGKPNEYTRTILWERCNLYEQAEQVIAVAKDNPKKIDMQIHRTTLAVVV